MEIPDFDSLKNTPDVTRGVKRIKPVTPVMETGDRHREPVDIVDLSPEIKELLARAQEGDEKGENM